MEVRPEAQKRWGEVIAEKSTFNPEASRNCTPGAFNNENADANVQPGVFATAYGGGPIEYGAVLQAWRSERDDARPGIRIQRRRCVPARP